jgi:hypothetical protein
MAVLANAAEVLQILNTTTSHHSHAVEAVRSQIFSCFALLAIVVNPIAVFVKFTIEELVPIVVKDKRLKNPTIHLLLQVNALAPQKKEIGVKTEPQILTVAATFIKILNQLKGFP